MRVYEVLIWNNLPAKRNQSNPDRDFPRRPFNNDLRKLANAFTRHGLVKHCWNPNRWEEQPLGPAPANAEPEVIPSGTVERAVATVRAEPVEEEPLVGQYPLVPLRRY
jgi:hypothetical protein